MVKYLLIILLLSGCAFTTLDSADPKMGRPVKKCEFALLHNSIYTHSYLTRATEAQLRSVWSILEYWKWNCDNFDRDLYEKRKNVILNFK